MPSGHDLWWEVLEASDLVALAAEVAGTVVEHGLPFFEWATDSGALLGRLRAGTGLPGVSAQQAGLVHAMLAVEEGATSEARHILARALANAGDSPFAETVRLVAARVGLEMLA